MSIITYSFAPAGLLTGYGTTEKEVSAARRAPKKQALTANEPEHRLWKLTASVAQPRIVKVHLLILFLFLTLAVVSTVACFSELSRLITTNAVEHVAEKALGQ